MPHKITYLEFLHRMQLAWLTNSQRTRFLCPTAWELIICEDSILPPIFQTTFEDAIASIFEYDLDGICLEEFLHLEDRLTEEEWKRFKDSQYSPWCVTSVYYTRLGILNRMIDEEIKNEELRKNRM